MSGRARFGLAALALAAVPVLASAPLRAQTVGAQARADSAFARALASAVGAMAQREAPGAPALLVWDERHSPLNRTAATAIHEHPAFHAPYRVDSAFVVRVHDLGASGDTTLAAFVTSRCAVRDTQTLHVLRFVRRDDAFAYLDELSSDVLTGGCAWVVQSAGDTAALARAMAEVLSGQMDARSRRDGAVAGQAPGAFGRAVVAALRRTPGFGRVPDPRHALHVDADSIAVAGELVTVVLRTSRTERGGGMSSWSNTTAYTFAREIDGYVLASVLTLDSADGGSEPGG